jgi:hypothetical protein
MFTCKTYDTFTTRILAGLVITVAVAFGSLVHAVSSIETYI